MGLKTISLADLLTLLHSDEDEWGYDNFWLIVRDKERVLAAGYSDAVREDLKKLMVESVHIIWQDSCLIVYGEPPHPSYSLHS